MNRSVRAASSTSARRVASRSTGVWKFKHGLGLANHAAQDQPFEPAGQLCQHLLRRRLHREVAKLELEHRDPQLIAPFEAEHVTVRDEFGQADEVAKTVLFQQARHVVAARCTASRPKGREQRSEAATRGKFVE